MLESDNRRHPFSCYTGIKTKHEPANRRQGGHLCLEYTNYQLLFALPLSIWTTLELTDKMTPSSYPVDVPAVFLLRHVCL